MPSFRSSSIAALAMLGLVACSAEATSDGSATGDGSEQEVKSVKGVSKADRERYVHTAQFILPNTNVKSKNLLVGPEGKGSFKFNEEVQCTFVEPTSANSLSGTTSKFECMVGDKSMRVKYSIGPDDNGGLYGEILGTRLLWALGFGADRIYPVRLSCKGCPADPWSVYKSFKPGGGQQGGARQDRKFPYAVIEQKFDAPKIEEDGHDGQGLSFREIPHAFPVEGGPSLAQLDAFKLVAVFVKHADSKAANQRLVCLPDGLGADGKCTKPFGMIQDLGATFGGGATLFGFRLTSANPRLEDWNAGVWNDKGKCESKLKDASDGTMENPRISEGGRKVLADMLTQLSDQQLQDLFTVSRITERGEKIGGRAVTVDDWVGLFKKHVADITSAKCPNP